MAVPEEEMPSALIEARVVDERGAQMRTSGTAQAERLAMNFAANALLIDADAVHVDPMSWNYSPRKLTRRTWAMLALFLAIIAAVAALMGVLIPRGSTVDSKEGFQTGQEDQVCQPSAALTPMPSLLPSLAPMVDPDALRFKTIRSILVPISGAEALLNITSSQH